MKLLDQVVPPAGGECSLYTSRLLDELDSPVEGVNSTLKGEEKSFKNVW